MGIRRKPFFFIFLIRVIVGSRVTLFPLSFLSVFDLRVLSLPCNKAQIKDKGVVCTCERPLNKHSFSVEINITKKVNVI